MLSCFYKLDLPRAVLAAVFYWIVIVFRSVAIFPSRFCAVIVIWLGPVSGNGEVKCWNEPS